MSAKLTSPSAWKKGRSRKVIELVTVGPVRGSAWW